MVMGSDSQQVDIPSLRAVNKHFFVKVEIVDGDVLVEGYHIFRAVGVGERVTEGKINFLSLILKSILENTFQLPIFPHY